MMRTRSTLALLAAFLLIGASSGSAAVPGPIHVSANGHYFVDRDGKPFFWLGGTAWPLFSDYSQAQAEAYLRDRAAKGFTVIQCALAWVLPPGNANDATVPPSSDEPQPNRSGERPWLDDNPATPNGAYFKHVDELVRFANDQGLVLAMLPVWGYYVNQTHRVNAANARAYGRWLGRRYKDAPNVVWVNGGDRVPTGYEEVYRALAEGLREGDGGAHLITYHPCGWHSSSQFFQSQSWLDFNMIQTWTDWPMIYPSIAADRMLSPPKPVVLGEGAYEDGPEYPLGPITPLTVRRQAWWAVMAGGFFTYGQNQMWRMGKGWDSTFDTPGAAQAAKMKEIVTALPWWQAIPDQTLFASGVSSGRTLNAAMRSAKGGWALIYLSTQCQVFIHLDKILDKNVRATWVNPVTGERKEAGSFETGNRAGKMFPPAVVRYFETPPYWQDALLLLQGF
jgi:Protein of unknown function (DUF4038)/Putative collagen-binding domain of a collagenase